MVRKIVRIKDLQERDTKCIFWIPEKSAEAKGIIQISHGMEEHIERYEDFAKYMADNGYVVCASDHPGHGIELPYEELGYFGDSGYVGCINRLHCVTLKAKQLFPDLPIILLGHSMGSFMSRAYITRYGNELDGAIIMGTAGPNPLLGFAHVLIKVLTIFRGNKKKSKFIDRLMFGSYNKKFEGDSEYLWLTKDKEIIKEYENDKYCGFGFTLNGYKALVDVLSEVSDKKWGENVPRELPILITSGEDDPVGGYMVGVKKVYKMLSKVNNVKLISYKNDRHEILNETDRGKVYSDILSFANTTLKI